VFAAIAAVGGVWALIEHIRIVARSNGWSWALTKLSLILIGAHIVLLFSMTLLPTDWDREAVVISVAALAVIPVAVISGGIAMWIDYRSGNDIGGPRAVLGVTLVAALVMVPATVLEKSYGYNWWLMAAGCAAVVVPGWLYLTKRRRRPDNKGAL
jgi:hypothetical protein